MNYELPGNPYADYEPQTEAAGVINAVGALTYEQRTANLIAYLQRVDASLAEVVPTTNPLPLKIRRDLHEQVSTRLGLEE